VTADWAPGVRARIETPNVGSHSASLSPVVTRLKRPRREASRSSLFSAQITVLFGAIYPPNYCDIFFKFFLMSVAPGIAQSA
jgi:hypothetical protein